MKLRSRLLPEERYWFNSRYATVESEGQFLVIRLEDSVIYKPEEFKKAEADKRRILSPRKPPLKLADEWLLDPKRLHYPYGFTFDPSIPPVEDHLKEKQWTTFNLWKGFAVAAEKGDVQPFLNFVLEIICSNDVTLFHWVMAWLANIFQEPAKKPGTALVLRGEQGIGKSFFVSCIGLILGDRNFIEVNDPEHTVGRFGGHLKGKLALCADEGSFTTDKSTGKLKNLITADKIALEEKYRNTISIDNHMRIFITGNDLRLITASRDERRYCVIDVHPVRKGDMAYWKMIHEWRDNGGLAALHHYLLNYPIEGVDLRTVPKTKALTEQKIGSLDDIERWFLDVLRRGYIRPGPPWGAPVGNSIIRHSYAEYYGLKEMSGFDSSINRKLNEIFPKAKKSRKRVQGQQEYNYHFPPLEECRHIFAAYLNGEVDWPDIV